MAQQEPEAGAASAPKESPATAPAEPGHADTPPMDPLENPEPATPDDPPGDETDAREPSENMPQSKAAFQLALNNARLAMAERDLAGARKYLDTAKTRAQTDEHRQAAQRVGVVLEHLAEFWRGLHEAAGALQSGQELAVKDTFVVIVEASPDELLIRSAGQNLPFRVADLPGALVLAVAESWFEKSANSKVLVGSFLCFDAKGHAQMGRQLLKEAGNAGLDVKPFFDELDAGGSGAEVGRKRTNAGDDAGGKVAPIDSANQTPPAAGTPPTNPMGPEEVEEAVREEFADKFREATTAVAKSRLAMELINKAGRARAEKRMAMLREAQRLAVEAGNVQLAMETIDSLARLPGIDLLTTKAGAMEDLLETAHGANGQRQIAQAALQLIERAAAQRRLPEAIQLADIAVTSARNSNNANLMRQAAFFKQHLDAMQKK